MIILERRPYFVMDELFMFQYLLDLRYSRQGWRCTACNSPIKKGKLMGWASLKGAFPPDVVMWDSLSCLDLMKRNGVFPNG